VHQYAIAQFISYIFISSMELGPLSPRNAFGAARHTMPFDRVSSDIQVGWYCLFCIALTSTSERANNNPPFCQQD
jgi:hypothetical protein